MLVTGGAGYIGSHTCKALARAGFQPVTLDNMVYGHEWAVKWGPLVKADLADTAALDYLFSAYRPIAVLHFAAFAYVGESVTAPEKYYRNNVCGTINLVDAMLQHGCRHRIFKHLRQLRGTHRPSNFGGPGAAADQPIRLEQAHGRANSS